MNFYYRYVEVFRASSSDDRQHVLDTLLNMEVELFRYVVIRNTSKGVFISRDQYYDNHGDINIYTRTRFIRNSAKKKFAWPTPKEAAISYYERKKNQVRILTDQLQLAHHCLSHAKFLMGEYK